jgi:predicted TIM-barrel fold metal-dependent hydrolase
MTQRETGTGSAAELSPPADDAPWIDAHSHIWSPETDRFPLAAGRTRSDLDPPSFTDDQLTAVARPEGVGRVVLIQHSVYHRFDNSYLLDAVRRHPRTFRAVGMVDDRGPEPGAAMMRLLPQGVTGFRITPFVRSDDPGQWLDTPGMHAMWETGAETRQALCCLIDPRHLPGVDEMCARHPATPVVIDHFARIGVDGPIRDDELRMLCQLARHPNTAVKVSAFYALGDRRPPYLDLVPMIRRVYEAFGPRRLMWGSDAPYQVRGGHGYSASIGLVRDRLEFVTPGDRRWLLRETAERVFFFA